MVAQRSFIEIIKEHINSGEMVLPVFNTTALRVQQELAKKEPDIRIIEKMILYDQSLSSQILKLANSSFYQGLSEILTIKSAIVRLGTQEISKITLLASAKSQFRSSSPVLNKVMKQLWQHSVGCAIGANWLAKRCELSDLTSHVFFAGLLHDIGKLFILLILEDLKKKSQEIPVNEAILHEAMKSLHTEQGYNLMIKWNMPEIYCVVARDHHIDAFDSSNILLVLVRLANKVCCKLGIGTSQVPDLVPSTSREATLLNLTEIDLAELEILLEDTKVLSSQ
ncbi:MAG: HD-like signal output (HDOD) protein [Desulforhopalus sp.]|jgi:HD-like signal output (HDOD) protein